MGGLPTTFFQYGRIGGSAIVAVGEFVGGVGWEKGGQNGPRGGRGEGREEGYWERGGGGDGA